VGTLPKFSSIHWEVPWAAGSFGNAGVPTTAGIWCDPKSKAKCPTNYVNSQWTRSDMVYPNGSCEVSVGPINSVDTEAENWTDTWHPSASPRQSCPTYTP
jgi:hypothetical protein